MAAAMRQRALMVVVLGIFATSTYVLGETLPLRSSSSSPDRSQEPLLEEPANLVEVATEATANTEAEVETKRMLSSEEAMEHALADPDVSAMMKAAFVEIAGKGGADAANNASDYIDIDTDKGIVGGRSLLSTRDSHYCNKVIDKASGMTFVCPPGYRGGGKGICKLTAPYKQKGADPRKYMLPTKKKWPNIKWGTVHAGAASAKGYYKYHGGIWTTTGMPTYMCSGSKLLNSGKSCWTACKKQGGFCDWCGTGNACCKRDFANDPSECQGLPGSSFVKSDVHICVMPAHNTDVQWFADSTCHVNKGENCYTTCDKVGMACDGSSFSRVISEMEVQRAAAQAGLKCGTYTKHSGSGVWKGPWIKNSNLQCGYHGGPKWTASCAVHLDCSKSLLCPCKSNYIAHHAGQGKCPPGYKYIIDSKKCLEAARSLGAVVHLNHKRGHYGTSGPAGCFQNPGKGEVNFNKDNTGTEVDMNSMSYICMGEGSSYVNAGTQQNECPVGYMRIKSKALCLAAGKELHASAGDGINKPYRIQNSPHEPNGCYFKVNEASKAARIHLNIPTLPGSFLKHTESLICMSETVMEEIEAKKAEMTKKNYPQNGKCAPGYKPKAGGLTNFGPCYGSYATGYCILAAGEAKRLCDKTPECAGVSETFNKVWQKAYPKMQQLGKASAAKSTTAKSKAAIHKPKILTKQTEWKTCVKGPKADPCKKAALLNDTAMVKLAKTPSGTTKTSKLLEVGEQETEMDELAEVEESESESESGEEEEGEEELEEESDSIRDLELAQQQEEGGNDDREVVIGSLGELRSVGARQSAHLPTSGGVQGGNPGRGGPGLLRRAGGSVEAGATGLSPASDATQDNLGSNEASDVA